ncbi:glycoside hydrolase family 3 N-terminal domain-containing protein [Enterococcus asini]|uniref:glycoside hydrolase family 3 N-terminal domain-containing protein n=1 Tax=Enterococcus asini TaxID=57732 RepID=UPI00289032DB|nr:glycoside hydrolase family 3 N-terminal domain-containing protein [Enterococcus asini]MDT2764946.1 glycoside hydrolase family 3 N-terminal domain-containing protein [Enterococcus asini]
MGKRMFTMIGAGCLVILVVVMGLYFFTDFGHTPKPGTTNESKSSASTTSTVVKSSTSESSDEKTEDDKVANLVAEMSTKEKVGQLFLARVPVENALSDIQEYHLGGYLIFGRDVEGKTYDEVQSTIAQYQETSEVPMLIAADEEGGTVSRVSRNSQLVATPFQSPQDLYAQGGWDAITKDTTDKAGILKELGIDAGLFPVADVATDPNAFIYDRTIGQDAKGTAEYVTTVVKALKKAQSGSTLKHFPGYGNNQDSHTDIVTDTRSMEELKDNDLVPFQAGIDAGVDSILVSHNIVNAIDDSVPASVSAPVHDLLRKDMGFDGVIMTDDMDMAGLADFMSQEEAGLKALQAGNDLILSSTYASQIPYVLQAIEDGEYSEKDLDASVTRVLNWKEELGLLAE